jgi:hypothetical protein
MNMDKKEQRRIRAQLMRDEMTLKTDKGFTVYDLNYRSEEENIEGSYSVVIIPEPYNLTDLTFEPKPGFKQAHTIAFESDKEGFRKKLNDAVSSHINILQNSEEWKSFWHRNWLTFSTVCKFSFSN